MRVPSPTPAPAGARDAADPLPPGSVLADRYEITRRLGTGGMGSVYLARHREMDRLCAIKVLHPALSTDPEAQARFAREARHASRIRHRNVCTVYDFGTAPGGQTFLAMEYVEGRPLGAILAERGRLPLRRAAHLAGEIAAGLDAAHALGVIHRDLKPDNVIVSGDPETVTLLDFGIAKAAAPDLRGELTGAGVVIGTPDYMSPEQFAGDPVDHRSDVYALGLLCYRMVAGVLPFRAPTARESLARRLADPPEPLAAAAPDLAFPPAVQAVLDRALAREPANRFDSAGALARALAQAALAAPADREEDRATVRLDAPTARVEPEVPPTRVTGGRGRRARPALLAALAMAGGVTVWGLWLNRGAGDGDPARPAPGRADSAGPSPAGESASPPISPPASPASAPIQSSSPSTRGAKLVSPPIPALPSVEELSDPRSRGDARARAEAIFERPDAPLLDRAQAAFSAATVYQAEGRYGEAVLWATRAQEANDSLPPSAERARRRERYLGFLTRARDQLKEPIPP